MLRSTVGKVMWVGRATVFLVGLAVILALLFGVASTALGTNGKPFLLGKKNTASKVSKLIKSGVGPALQLGVDSGPPLGVNSSEKVANLNADQVDGKSATNFVSSNVIKRESAIEAGTTLGDGTSVIAQSCNPGEILLSGGPANVASTSTLLESFPSPGSTNSWSARINKNGQTDNFSVVVLCASP
jgi:hypothetical protein